MMWVRTLQHSHDGRDDAIHNYISYKYMPNQLLIEMLVPFAFFLFLSPLLDSSARQRETDYI